MTPTVLHLISISAKIALLGGLAWLQLYFLRRAPAGVRSRVCSLALAAIVLFAAGEMMVTAKWMAQGPVLHLTATASSHALAGPSQAKMGLWIVLLWMAGAAFLLVRAVSGRVALAVLRRRSTLLEHYCGLEVRIGKVETPVLTGVLRPAIVLPVSVCDWTDEQRRMVLTHEFTHFRQGDCWSNLLAQTVRAAFWFHPVVWLLAARMSREQELTCDEAVVASGQSRHDYAAFLLDAVRNLRSREMFACAMAGSGAGSLKRRFANLLDPRPRTAMTRRLVASLAIFAAAASMLAVVRPVWSQDQQKQPKAYRAGNGVTPPRVLYKVDPEYTPQDRAAKVSGTVILRMIVTAEGEADDIRVVQPLTPGLDQKAIEAIEKWTFQPGTKDGKAVPVYATIEVNFRLR